MRRLPGEPSQLPSVEAQTIEFFEEGRRADWMAARYLRFGGFEVYLRYRRNVTLLDGSVLGEVLVIARVTIPRRYRERGWFWRYCQLCAALANDGVIVEAVLNPWLLEALRRHPEFREYATQDFLLQKTQPGAWPLSIR